MNPLIITLTKFVLFPLLMVVGLFVISKLKKAKSLANNKRLIIFTLLFGIVGILPVVFLGLLENHFYPYVLIVSYAWFILYGFIFLWFISKQSWYESIGFKENTPLFVLSLILSLCIANWAYYLIFELLNTLDYPFLAALSVWSIALPICYKETEEYFTIIPAPVYKLWHPEYESDLVYWETLDLRSLNEINIRFKRNPQDIKLSKINVKIPAGVPMGQWFQRFVEDHDIKYPSTPIILQEDEGELYRWGFYHRKWFGMVTKPLDFQKLTDELGLKHNSVVIARREALS